MKYQVKYQVKNGYHPGLFQVDKLVLIEVDCMLLKFLEYLLPDIPTIHIKKFNTFDSCFTWMPRGLRCDDHIGEEVAKRFNLQESDGGHMKRDRQNAGILIGHVISKLLDYMQI